MKHNVNVGDKVIYNGNSFDFFDGGEIVRGEVYTIKRFCGCICNIDNVSYELEELTMDCSVTCTNCNTVVHHSNLALKSTMFSSLGEPRKILKKIEI